MKNMVGKIFMGTGGIYGRRKDGGYLYTPYI